VLLDKVLKKAIKFVEDNWCSIINLPVGQGKTRIISEYLRKQPEHSYWVVMCPKSIVGQWDKEFAKEGFIDRIKDGPGIIWYELVPDVYIYLTSQHQASKVHDLRQATGWVIDEPKMLKSETIFREYLMSRNFGGKKVLLDATLLENNFEELHRLEEFLGVKSLPPITFSPPVEALRKIKKSIIRIPLTVNEAKMEKYLNKQLLAALRMKNKFLINSRMMEAINYLSSTEGRDPGKSKIQAVVSYVNDHPGARGIVFTRSLVTLEALNRSLGRLRPTAKVCGALSASARSELREKFNAGEIDWIVATKAGERGIDLFSGNTVIHFDLPFSQSSYRQRDRVTRRSSDLSDTTKIITVLIEGSLEELQLEHIKAKMKMDAAAKTGDFDFIPRTSWTQFLEDKYAK
jgi:hypothetical protein